MLAVLLAALGVVLQRVGDEDVVRPSGASLRLVPDDALAVIQVSADQTRGQVDDALRRLDGLPGGTALLGRLRDQLVPPACPSVPVDARDATVALVRIRPGGPAVPLVLIDRGGLRRDAGPVRRCGGRTAQRLGRYVAIGPSSVVRAARRLLGRPRARGSIAALPLYRRLVAGLPDDRILTAWMTPDAVRRVLPARGRGPATIAAALDRPDLGGVTAGVVPTDDGARLVVRLDTAPPAAAPFGAAAPVAAPAGAVGTLLTTDALGAASRVLDLVSAAQGRTPQGLGPLLSAVVERIDVATGGAVRRDVVDARRTPSEVVLTPGSGPGADGLAVTVVVPVTDGRRAAAALARLRPRLARALARRGTAPRIRGRRVAGHRSWSVRLPGGGGVGYLVDGDRLVVFTSAAAAEAVLGPGPRFTDRVGWDRESAGSPNLAMSIGFLDFSLLLRVAVPSAASTPTADRALLDGLGRVRAVTMRSRTDGREATFDVDLRIP